MKNVLITGAGGVLGKACVNEFIDQGYHVIAILSPKKKIDYPTASPISTYNADLINESNTNEVLDQIIKDHKAIDVALLLVGGFAMGSIEKTDGVTIKKMFALNFDTAFYTGRKVFGQMLTQSKGGRMVMVGSRPSLDPKAGKGLLAYALSKSLIFKFAELLNAEGSEKNVFTTIIVPSIIDTPDNREGMPKANPDKWVKAEDIASIVAFATSEKGAALREPVIRIYGES